MAHSHKLSNQALKHVAAQAAAHWPRDRDAHGRNDHAADHSANRVVLAETFELWTLAESEIAKPWHTLADIATATGRWHHQVRRHGENAARHFVRSAKHRSDDPAAPLAVTAVMASPIAEKIAAGIVWIDKHEAAINSTGIEDPLVRLLVIPSRAIHALWLVSYVWDRILIVDAPCGDLDRKDFHLLDLNAFHELLRHGTPIGAPQSHSFAHPLVKSGTAIAPAAPISDSEHRDERLISDVRKFLVIFMLANFLSMLIAAAGTQDIQSFLRVLSVWGLLSGAWFIGGTLLGFIFGIPRSLASSSAAIAQRPPAIGVFRPPGSGNALSGPTLNVRPNTNLEQISDWLTKVLVGVGLTQVSQLERFVQLLAVKLGPAFAPLPHSGVIAVAISAALCLVGFGWGYFESRTTLMRVFSDEGGTPNPTAAIISRGNAVAETSLARDGDSAATMMAQPSIAATPSTLGPTPRP